jgi:hypothetical protein
MANVNRVPAKDIVPGSPIVLPEGHPDLVFLNPKNVIIKQGKSFVYDTYLAPDPTNGNPLNEPNLPAVAILPSSVDIVELSDIESITYEKYYDSVTKEEKAKAIVKIRNNSNKADTVQGVDARIYNPNA